VAGLGACAARPDLNTPAGSTLAMLPRRADLADFKARNAHRVPTSAEQTRSSRHRRSHVELGALVCIAALDEHALTVVPADVERDRVLDPAAPGEASSRENAGGGTDSSMCHRASPGQLQPTSRRRCTA